jgi:hypothetical protein
MAELESRLDALAREVSYPPTPALSEWVADSLRTQPPSRARLSSRAPRAIAIAVGILLLFAAGVLAASPAARDAFIDLFGLRGARIARTTTPAPSPPPTPRRLHLGGSTGIGSLSFTPVYPGSLGTPDSVHVHRRLPGGSVALAYRPQPGLPRASTTGLGLLLTEFRGDLDPEYLTKIVPQATVLRGFRIGRDRASWIAGAPHFFFYRRPTGGLGFPPLRIAQNVLLVQHGRLLLRFEGAFTLRRAKELARSLRPGTARTLGL